MRKQQLKRLKMKKFRVWAYETSGYYKEVEAENKKEADELVYPHGVRDETWIEGNDGESYFIINKDNTEEIEVKDENNK